MITTRLLLFGLIIFLGSTLISAIAGIFLAQSRLPGSVEVFIPKGTSTFGIAQKLKDAKIIKDPLIFVAISWLSGDNANFSAGRYGFTPSKVNVVELIDALSHGKGRLDVVTFTISPGESNAEIFFELSRLGLVVPLGLDRAAEFEKRFYFLKNFRADSSLQGYLFPDTYVFTEGESGRDVIERMLENFENKVLRSYNLDLNYLHALVTLASLLEKEVPDSLERRVVSGILLKRIEAGLPLQVDATICYIKSLRRFQDEKLMGNFGSGCLPITSNDLSIDSPYNTYRYSGLTPGPIANPGLDAIFAAHNPKSSPYLYYLSDPKTGYTVFSQTFAEHQAAKQRYLAR